MREADATMYIEYGDGSKKTIRINNDTEHITRFYTGIWGWSSIISVK